MMACDIKINDYNIYVIKKQPVKWGYFAVFKLIKEVKRPSTDEIILRIYDSSIATIIFRLKKYDVDIQGDIKGGFRP
jgi:hypothetical protein